MLPCKTLQLYAVLIWLILWCSAQIGLSYDCGHDAIAEQQEIVCTFLKRILLEHQTSEAHIFSYLQMELNEIVHIVETGENVTVADMNRRARRLNLQHNTNHKQQQTAARKRFLSTTTWQDMRIT